MKILSTIMLLGILGIHSCNGQEAQLQNVVFSSRTRGGVKKVEINTQKVVFENNDGQWSKTISSNDWKQLVSIVNNISLDDFEQYSSKESERSRDAAWHSILSIQVSGEEYTSQTFDDENPPKQLLGLMQYIIKLDKQLNKPLERLF